MDVLKADVLRSIRKYGPRGAHFQSRDLRTSLGIGPSDTDTASRLHNQLRALERDGVIEEVPGNRKRNKYFRVKDEAVLRGLSAWEPESGNGSGRVGSGATDRFAKIEASLHTIAERLALLDSNLNKLVGMWS